MGRRIAVAVAIAALPLIAATTPAVAKSSKRTLTMSTQTRHAQKLRPGTRLPSVVPSDFDTVQYDGYRAECTAPTGPKGQGPNGQNFHSSNTVDVKTTSNEMVENCSANLKHTFGLDGKKIAYDHTAVVYAVVQSCRAYAPTSGTLSAPGAGTPTVAGTGFTVTYPTGLFIETCVAPLTTP